MTFQHRQPQHNMISGLKWSFMLLLILLQGCALMRLDDSLAHGVLNHDDPELVAEALPTYLLLMDGLIENWPQREELLTSGASLYSVYASQFVQDPQRAGKLHDRALEYARRGLCQRHKALCDLDSLSVPELETQLQQLNRRDVPAIYALGTVWAGWVEHNSGDWNAVAQLARVQSLIQRVIELDERHDHGQAHMYMGVLYSLLPAALGGRPEKAREHFEKAIALSDGQNQMARVLLAERYARMAFDRDLHDRLLDAVLESDADPHGLVLQNTFARREARRLLNESADYFF